MKFSSPSTIFIFFLSFILFGFSCKIENSHAAEDIVYYYPQKNIYYDSLRSNYYYSLDSARTWDSLAFNAPGYGTVLGPKVPVKRTGNVVWANNESHRKEYHGVIFNIVNSRTLSLTKADRINKLRAFVKSETQPQVIEKEPPPEKGLKKFFNRLFGKKKKPAEEKKQ
jgi:hypothetical protein